MNGPLFISKPHCYPNLSITFYVMGTGNTNESSLENTPIKFTIPCIIATFNTIRAQSFPYFMENIWWILRANLRPEPVMMASNTAGIKRGEMVSRWQEEFSRWDGKYH